MLITNVELLMIDLPKASYKVVKKAVKQDKSSSDLIVDILLFFFNFKF